MTSVLGSGGAQTTAILYYRLRRAVAQWDLTPAQLTGIYLVLGFSALYFSDVLLVGLVDDPATLSQLQTVKGGVEIVATGGLLFALTRRSRRVLERSNARLQRQQHELEVLHRVFRHNLRNDLNVIHGFTESLQNEVETEQHREWCETVLSVAEQVIHYADQVRLVNKATEYRSLTTVDAVAVVERVLESHPALTGTVTVETALPETAVVESNRMLEAALRELISNAVEHNDTEHPTLEVRVDPSIDPGHLTELVIEDNGPGIPDYVRDAVRNRGEDQHLHLDGLGLWCAFWAVTTAGGDFQIEDRELRGTRIRIRLPMADRQLPLLDTERAQPMAVGAT